MQANAGIVPPMGDAFFIPEDESRFISTDWTRGPWDPLFQHGGPPAALLGRAVERVAEPGLRVARIAFDLLRPVPVAPLDLAVEVVRPGKKVNLVEASLASEGKTVMRASAWLFRVDELELPRNEPEDAPEPPGEEPSEKYETSWSDKSYLAAMDPRFVSGSFMEIGPAIAWFRMRVPLIEGESVGPLTRVLVAADSGNGISAALPFTDWTFVNPDLTVHLFRYPEGEWVCLDAVTTPHASGIGMATSKIYDEKGRIGEGAQSLFISHC